MERSENWGKLEQAQKRNIKLEKLGQSSRRFEIGTREGGNSRTTSFEVDGLSSKAEVSQEIVNKYEHHKKQTSNIYYWHCNGNNTMITAVLSLSKQ